MRIEALVSLSLEEIRLARSDTGGVTRYAISASVVEAVAPERRVRCTSCGGSSLDW
jgi:hypothetical protein